MGHDLAIKQNEILPFATAWIDLEGIMLIEVRQRKTNTIWFHSYVESKEQNKWINKTETDAEIQRTNWWLPEGWGLGDGVERWRDEGVLPTNYKTVTSI